MHLIGSHNGIDWDTTGDVCIGRNFSPDTQSSIVWDSQSEKFVCFTRGVNLYGGPGQRRRIARLEHDTLWEEWPIYPETILIPDEVDAEEGYSKFYGMPVRTYAGIHWGCLWPYRPDREIHTELAFSRDGRAFHRMPQRPRLIDRGAVGEWDAGMVFGNGWVEVGQEWWLYYCGNNQHHGAQGGVPGIGIARIRKEGFASLRTPAGGGNIVTKLLKWPGGSLRVNANLKQTELKIKVTDFQRKPVEDFTDDWSIPVHGDGTELEVKWEGGELAAMQGRALRLEFRTEGLADLYGFRAAVE